jgi:magnesium transporter
LIRTLVYTQDGKLLENVPLNEIRSLPLQWYWVDFNAPTMEETHQLNQFPFHPLSIKECLHGLSRPKLEYYENYMFYTIHKLNQDTWAAEEIALFTGDDYLVTFHYQEHKELDELWERLLTDDETRTKGISFFLYKVMDKVVDQYFPVAQKLEERIDVLEAKTRQHHAKIHFLMNEVFTIRGQLLALRHIVWPMRDLLYRILNSERVPLTAKARPYYRNIYAHLEKLAAMIESSRELTADIRDNYLSLNAHRTNSVMMILTVITVIFMPLTFIAGIYGMNFDYMPELHWKYGYFAVLGVMALIAFLMYIWFKKKGWFNED